MANAERNEFTWGEETITEIVMNAASSRVTAIPFTKKQEGGNSGTGADWLWWWLGEDGTAFGMLVQAKRLHKDDSGRWTISFNFKTQRATLLSTAKRLNVAATYVVYFGTPSYRFDVACGGPDHGQDWSLSDFEDCGMCQRKTIAFLSAVTTLNPDYGDAEHAYELAIPIEDLADPAISDASPWVSKEVPLTRELEQFLREKQSGPQKVAKAQLAKLLYLRSTEFTHAAGTVDALDLTANDEISEAFMFPTLPDDADHHGMQPFPEALRGLRTTPPPYVLDLLNGYVNDFPENLGITQEEISQLAGMVVVDARGI
jgi:hypothetical protein